MKNQTPGDENNDLPDGPGQTLALLDETLAVCRMAPDAPLPAWVAGNFWSVTRTPAELSVVCAQALVPAGVMAERDWRALRVAGPLDFSLTGVLSGLAAPLARAGISIFALSTFDTDYLLVKAADLERAVAVLRSAGHRVNPPSPSQ